MTRRFQTGDIVRVRPEFRKPGFDYPDMVVRWYSFGSDIVCRRVDWETAEGRHDCITKPGRLEKVQ